MVKTLKNLIDESCNKVLRATQREILDETRECAKAMGCKPPPFPCVDCVNIFLYHDLFKKYLDIPVDDIQAMELPSAEELWYGNIMGMMKRNNRSTNLDFSAISIPISYICNPEVPVSCALFAVVDTLEGMGDRCLAIAKNGIGVGVECLAPGDLISALKEMDEKLLHQEGKRQNFVAVNVLACHPQAQELLLRCNKSAGVFFQKIHIGFWWSPEFLRGNEIPILRKGTNLMDVKMNPSSAWDHAVSSYTLEDLVQAKVGGGIPYLFHIEGRADYTEKIYGSNLCTEISLPLVSRKEDGKLKIQSQLCVLGNIDISKMINRSMEDKRKIYRGLVDIVDCVWTDLKEKKDILAGYGLGDVDFESMPCGIGVTGVFSAACFLNQDYDYDFVHGWLSEMIRECNMAFDSLEQNHAFRFSIPPSSNAEKNMLSSPNIQPWGSEEVLLITQGHNICLKNPYHMKSKLTYKDMMMLQQLLDQSMSIDLIIEDLSDIEPMLEYMIDGYFEDKDGNKVKAKTISYYVKRQVDRSVVQQKVCDRTCKTCDV